jgi:hypothetical protein
MVGRLMVSKKKQEANPLKCKGEWNTTQLRVRIVAQRKRDLHKDFDKAWHYITAGL